MMTLIPKIILPEFILSVAACLLLLLDGIFQLKRKWILYVITLLVLVIVAYSCAHLYYTRTTIYIFNAFVLDNFAIAFKIVVCLIVSVVLIYSKQYMEENNLLNGEYFSLCLFSIVGIMIIISCTNFLTLYLGMELFYLPLYALCVIDKNKPVSIEAGLKYFIMSILISGLFLYGISLLYAITGTINFIKIVNIMSTISDVPKLALSFSILFIVSTVAFKLGLVPFHMWMPDIYSGASIPMILFIATVSKLAAFAIAIRIFMETLVTVHMYWQLPVILIAVLSVIFGNVVAIVQINVKKMLAYSTIGHMGFVFLGFVINNNAALIASMFYMIVYVITLLGMFGIILLFINKKIDFSSIYNFCGLAVKNPWIAFITLLLLLSMMGVPPTVGFYAKFLIIKELLHSDFTWLAIIALIFAVVGSFNYLRIIKLMFFDKPYSEYNIYTQFNISAVNMLVLCINGLAILFLGIFPSTIHYLCMNAIF